MTASCRSDPPPRSCHADDCLRANLGKPASQAARAVGALGKVPGLWVASSAFQSEMGWGAELLETARAVESAAARRSTAPQWLAHAERGRSGRRRRRYPCDHARALARGRRNAASSFTLWRGWPQILRKLVLLRVARELLAIGRMLEHVQWRRLLLAFSGRGGSRACPRRVRRLCSSGDAPSRTAGAGCSAGLVRLHRISPALPRTCGSEPSFQPGVRPCGTRARSWPPRF